MIGITFGLLTNTNVVSLFFFGIELPGGGVEIVERGFGRIYDDAVLLQDIESMIQLVSQIVVLLAEAIERALVAFDDVAHVVNR